MDAARFDALAKSLITARSRRRVLGGLLAGALGLLALRAEETEAHNPIKACKKKSGDAKKRCIKKAKKHNAKHAADCTPTTCAAQGKNCGSIADGCGGTLSCGSCSPTPPQTCGGGGTANVCGCTPNNVACTFGNPAACCSQACCADGIESAVCAPGVASCCCTVGP
jgi:hypothetical protein